MLLFSVSCSGVRYMSLTYRPRSAPASAPLIFLNIYIATSCIQYCCLLIVYTLYIIGMCVLQGMLYTVDPSSEAAVESTTASTTGVWLLDTSVEVTNGVTFEIKGTGIGGDCDEVRWLRVGLGWVGVQV